jgi:aspartate aminotransferase-like enzyme
VRKPLLMIPGPVGPPDEVLRRCGMPVFPHYEGDFPAFYDGLVTKMKTIFGLNDGYVFIPNGSGTIAVNMAVVNLCTTEDDVLVIDNGAFGGYAEKILGSSGIPYTLVKGEWRTVIDPESVRKEMKRKHHPVIYMTHNESSTAVLNPIAPIGAIAREFDALLIADSVSCVGGVVIDMDRVGADVVAGASQKCLELPPGLAPVAVGKRAWTYIDKMKERRVPYILDFNAWKKAFIDMHDYHPQPVTGATNMLYALDWMADQILAEGLNTREERFRRAGETLKKGMAEYGFIMGADPRYASPVVTEFMTPEGVDSKDVRKYYVEKHNTMVGAGVALGKNKAKIEYSNKSFRVPHFGRAAEKERIEHLIAITKHFMQERK